MRRRLSRSLKRAAVWLVVGLVLVDSASACRRRNGCQPKCCPPPTCGCSSGGVDVEMPPALQSPSDEPAPPAPPAPEASAETRQPMPPPDEPAAPPVSVVEIPAIEEPAPVEVELAIEQPAPPPAAAAAPTPPPATTIKPTRPAISPDEDDPFAPVKPAPKSAPVDDDPFAPVPPKPAPARPAAATPAADPLQITADGQLPLREWVDDSGQFRTSGRLIAVVGDKVRILKETGRTTTVPMSRLSAADNAYVAEAIARHGLDLGEQLAAW